MHTKLSLYVQYGDFRSLAVRLQTGNETCTWVGVVCRHMYSVDEEKPSVPGGCSNEATYVQHC